MLSISALNKPHPSRGALFSAATLRRTQPVRAPRVERSVVAQAVPQELAQVALETGLIWGTAGVCAAMTLVVRRGSRRRSQTVRCSAGRRSQRAGGLAVRSLWRIPLTASPLRAPT